MQVVSFFLDCYATNELVVSQNETTEKNYIQNIKLESHWQATNFFGLPAANVIFLLLMRKRPIFLHSFIHSSIHSPKTPNFNDSFLERAKQSTVKLLFYLRMLLISAVPGNSSPFLIFSHRRRDPTPPSPPRCHFHNFLACSLSTFILYQRLVCVLLSQLHLLNLVCLTIRRMNFH